MTTKRLAWGLIVAAFIAAYLHPLYPDEANAAALIAVACLTVLYFYRNWPR